MVCQHILVQAPVLELEQARALASYHKDLAQALVLEPVRVPAQVPVLEPVRVLALVSYHKGSRPQWHASRAQRTRCPSS